MQVNRLRHRGFKWRAMLQLVFGRRRAAMRVFRAMLGEFPGDAYALASRAHVLSQLGRPEEALADARALVAAHPQRSAGDWFNLAFLLESTDRLDESEAAFRRAVELDPTSPRRGSGVGSGSIPNSTVPGTDSGWR